MDPGAYAYVAGGACDEVTLRDNQAAFARWRLRPRVLIDVGTVDPSTTLLGQRVAMPVGLAPTARQRLAHPDAEVAVARAAAAAGVVDCVSTMSSCSLEEVARAPAGPRWFQLYVHKDRGTSRALVERAVAAGYQAIVLTVDFPIPGRREGEVRTGFSLEPGGLGNFPHLGRGEEFMALMAELHDQRFTWDDLAWLRGLSRLPLVVKGILRADDALRAAEHGAAAVVVSNHGGRQLDGSPASIEVLEEVVQTVGDRAEVYLDGGVRRGTDVLVALALGARAVFVGRPHFFALAAGGEQGVAHLLALLHDEVANAMALLGAPRAADVARHHVHRAAG
ncbi:MAG TPA: alpha-hydroxy acid oxidase [Candidatus Eisenbacteria bacterium]|nr:alpha-hydroxy acid oxidase [Candidatus Eisenbacteria bacterium]